MPNFVPYLRLTSLVLLYLFSYFYFVGASDITIGSVGNNFSIPVNVGGTAYNITFSDDGNFMYLGTFASVVYQFSLPTPFDVTSAVYMNRSRNLSAQGSGMDEIRMNNDGDKLFVLQFYNNAVYQYTLTTPHNIVSARYDTLAKSVAGLNNYTIDFKPDGTRMFTLTDYNNLIYEYSFSTPWNLATISSNPISSIPTPNFANGQKLTMGILPNGGSMYIVTNTSQRVHWMSFATPWLLSSATYTSGKYVNLGTTDSQMRGLASNSSGSKLFFMGATNRRVYEFNLNDTVAPTITSINSSNSNGSYKIGDTIDITINFSESVTSSGPISLIFETGEIDRTCSINISNSSSGNCTYTVQAGDTSSDLNASLTGVVYDNSNNFLSNYTPASSLGTLKNIVIDTSIPEILSKSYTSVANSSVLILWSTNENSSSLVKYGPSRNPTTQTAEFNTSSRSTNHSVSVTNLLPCTLYYFQALSRDEASNSVESSLDNFTTSGCAISSIFSGNSERFSLSGGTLTFPNSGSTAKLIIPDNYATNPANFQINKLNPNTFTNPPTDLTLAGNNLFKLNAVTDDNLTLPSFINNVTFEIDYPESLTKSINENTFDIYKYNETGWEKKNCTLNKSSNKITCSLNNFSIYGLFGEILEGNSDNDSGDSNLGNFNNKNIFHRDRRCHYITPKALTWITFESKPFIKGIFLNWSLEHATHVDILIDNGTGNYPYKIASTSNDGKEFLANVESWQKIKIIPYNECKIGDTSNEYSMDLYPKGWFNYSE